MDVQLTPPPIENLVEALRPILVAGLPVSPSYADMTLLGLRGVVARSVKRDDRLGRVKALDELVARQLVHYPDDHLGESARLLFGLALGVRGRNLTARRQAAAAQVGYDPDHFRRRIEPEILRMLAWQLHRDSQNYTPRGGATPPPLESSGDTPVIRAGDLSSRDASEHQELLSRLWAKVYALRAEVLLVERLKVWPFDSSEPETSTRKLEVSIRKRDEAVKETRHAIQSYLATYGERISHGDADFNVESLMRLAGWESEE